MKKYIEGNLPHLSHKLWPNLVRVEISLTYESKGFLRYYSPFKQQINLHVNNSAPQNSRITSIRNILFRLQQGILIQIPIASELLIIYHTITRFRPSTII